MIAEQNRLREREQADQVDVSTRAVDGAQAGVLPEDNGEPVHMVAVTNRSRRPIRDVTAKLDARHADGQPLGHEKLADMWEGWSLLPSGVQRGQRPSSLSSDPARCRC
jgi:hypothetical protein